MPFGRELPLVLEKQGIMGQPSSEKECALQPHDIPAWDGEPVASFTNFVQMVLFFLLLSYITSYYLKNAFALS